MSAGLGITLATVSEEGLGIFSRRSLSTQEALVGPEQVLKGFLFRDSNTNAHDIDIEKGKKEEREILSLGGVSNKVHQ